MSLTPEGAASTTTGRLSKRTIATYAIGSLGTGGFATLPGLVLLFFMTDTLGVFPLLAGVLISVAKIWDVIIDPVIGARSDHSLAVTGSRRPDARQVDRSLSAPVGDEPADLERLHP